MAEACIGCEKPSWYVFHMSLKVVPKWAERPREIGNTGVIQSRAEDSPSFLSVSHSTSFISIPFYFPPPVTSNLSCFTWQGGCDVAPMKCDKQEFTAWINWAALQWTRLLIKLTEPLSVVGISLPLHFLHLFLSLPLPSIYLSICKCLSNTHTHQWYSDVAVDESSRP